MKLSRTAAYAIHALASLAEDPPQVPVPCCQLALRSGLPERYLLDILRNLAAHELVQSTRGSEGGFSLARPAATITLFDVVSVFETPRNSFMPDVDGVSPEARHLVMSALERAFDAAASELRQVTLADLCRAAGADKSCSNGAPDESTNHVLPLGRAAG